MGLISRFLRLTRPEPLPTEEEPRLVAIRLRAHRARELLQSDTFCEAYQALLEEYTDRVLGLPAGSPDLDGAHRQVRALQDLALLLGSWVSESELERSEEGESLDA